MSSEIDHHQEDFEEPPPLFKSWKAWYTVVLANLVVLIALFYLFMRIFE